MSRVPAGAVLLAVALVALGSGSATSSSVGKRQTTRTTIYFLIDDGRAPIGVRRSITRTPPPEGATVRGALKALFAGPSRAERKAGITTAVPAGTRLRSLSFKGEGGTAAVVDLSGLPPVVTTSAVVKVQVITQVARTLIGSGGIRRIWLRADGKPWDLLDMHGNVVNQPTDYDTLLGFWVDGFRALP